MATHTEDAPRILHGLAAANAPLRDKVTGVELASALREPRPDHPHGYAAVSYLSDVTPETLHQAIIAGELDPQDIREALAVYGPIRSAASEWFLERYPAP